MNVTKQDRGVTSIASFKLNEFVEGLLEVIIEDSVDDWINERVEVP